MFDRPPEIEASDAMLAEAAKMDLVAMRHVQQLVLGSEDAQDVGVLVHAYARVSRCMRQNLGLLARQKADRAKADREAARPPSAYPWEQTHPADARADELQQAVERVISTAAAGDRRLHTDWVHRLDREMDDWIEAPDFLLEDLDAQVQRACRTLGLPDDLAPRWRDLPDPTFFPEPQSATAEEVAAANAVAVESTARFQAAAFGRSPTDPAPPPVPWKNSG
jgi:hypothetical protein